MSKMDMNHAPELNHSGVELNIVIIFKIFSVMNQKN